MSSKIVDIVNKVPEYNFTQQEVFDSFGETFKNNEKFKKIFLNSGISKRHSVLTNPAQFFYESKKTTKQRNDIYFKEALDICSDAISECLQKTNTQANEIDELIIVSCTGVNIPGLDILLAKKFEMKSDLERTCILFMGCYAAFPALRKAWQYTKAKKDSKSLVVCVELCTLHFQYNSSMESIVSSSIFADGCSVALIENSDQENEIRPEIVDSYVYTAYDTTEHMAFNLTDEGFQMNLSSYVPDILKSNIQNFLSVLLKRNNLEQKDINHWLIHPGGMKILHHLQEELNLSAEDISYSTKVLNDYGNMSSATILFVLNELMISKKPEKGDKAVMMAFGPGLTMESMLLEWK